MATKKKDETDVEQTADSTGTPEHEESAQSGDSTEEGTDTASDPNSASESGEVHSDPETGTDDGGDDHGDAGSDSDSASGSDVGSDEDGGYTSVGPTVVTHADADPALKEREEAKRADTLVARHQAYADAVAKSFP